MTWLTRRRAMTRAAIRFADTREVWEIECDQGARRIDVTLRGAMLDDYATVRR